MEAANYAQSRSGQDSDARRAVVVAGHRGETSIIRAHLDHRDPSVRASALQALRRVDRLDAAVLVPALTDPDPGVRRRAILLSIRVNGCTAGIVSALEDPDHAVAETAAFALGEGAAEGGGEQYSRTSVTPSLSRAAQHHEDALVREAAVAALGSLGDPGGLPAVLAACSDRATVRRRAVLALAAFEGVAVTIKLREMSHDRDLQVRQAAEDLLAIEEGEQI